MDINSQLAEIIVSSSDSEELKNKIVKEIAVSLNASRCFLLEYDFKTNNFKKINNVFNTKREYLDMLGYDVENNLKYLGLKLKHFKSFVIEDTSEFIKENSLEDSKEQEYFEKYDVKSFLSVRLEFGNTFLGLLVLNYNKVREDLKTTDLEFLLNIVRQISISLFISNLYKEEKIKAQRETLLKTIFSIMGQEYDIEQVSNKIFDILGKMYNAQHIFIDINAKNIKRFYFYNFCKYSSDVIKDYEKNALLSIYNFPCFDAVKNKSNYISNIDNFIAANKMEYSSVHKYFKKNNIKSVILLPIVAENSTFGLVVITFDVVSNITNEDLLLIRTVAKQLGIVISHILLYEKEKETAQRELISKDIINKIRSSIELPKIKKEIVTQIAKLLNADAVFFGDYDYATETYNISEDAEYLASSDLKSSIGLDLKSIEGFVEHVRDVHLSGNDIIFDDIEEYVDASNIRGKEVEEFYRARGVVSSAAINVYYGDFFLGNIVISFSQKRQLSQDEIDFVRSLADQAGIAIYQAKLYENEKKSAQRELVLRKISELISSSLDSESIKKQLLSFICDYLEADRCFIADYNNDTDKFLPIQYEHLASEDEKSLLGKDVHVYFPNFANLKSKKNDNIIPDIDVFMLSSNFETEKERLQEYNVKSDYAIPILYADNLIGKLVVHYTKKKSVLDKEQFDILRHLATQTGIALHQTVLYEKISRQAERENALRQIMLSSVTILNFEGIINFIVTETGKLFKADRCFFVEYDYETDMTPTIRDYAQYRSSDSIRSHLDIPIHKESIAVFMTAIKQKKMIIANNIYDEDLSQESIKMLIDQLSVKSYLVAPVFYGDYMFGSIVFHYVNEFKTFNKEDCDFAEAVANQTAIILKQYELFEKERQAAEREKENKNLIEIMRSSMDKNVVKKLFVKNIGKFFKADRIFICEYMPKDKHFMPADPDSEYLSSPSLQSFVGIDFANGNYNQFHQTLSEKGELLIPSLSEFLKYHQLSEEEINLLENGEIKSTYSFPVVYEDKLIATFTIQFTQQEVHIKDEEIRRIRKICAQLGIALDHATLYQKAQEYNFSVKAIKNDFLDKIKVPTNNIMYNSNLLIQNEFERMVQIECLNSILSSCSQLMELTKIEPD